MDQRIQKADYGLDAPGLVRFFFLAGLACFACELVLLVVPRFRHEWLWALSGFLIWAGVYCVGMGCIMVYSSRVYKLAECERLLDRLELQGNERILDAGCGGGMMMNRAARRLDSGRVVGIDIWQGRDQSNNRMATPMRNATAEGVADRVEALTGDIRELPFPDRSFDVVMSHWVVHNLPTASDRQRALEEMARVLKPGGKLLIADIMHQRWYIGELNRLGFRSTVRIGPGAQELLYGLLTCGNFCPAALLAVLELHGAVVSSLAQRRPPAM
jgi:arsenite methyltransferase